jgi:hypothetical protein
LFQISNYEAFPQKAKIGKSYIRFMQDDAGIKASIEGEWIRLRYSLRAVAFNVVMTECLADLQLQMACGAMVAQR